MDESTQQAIQSGRVEIVEEQLRLYLQRDRLSKIISNDSTGNTREVRVDAPPFDRMHLLIQESKHEASAAGYSVDTETPPFTVVQYNILANELASAKHFPYVGEKYLKWKHRRYLIVRDALLTTKGIHNEGPDIIAMQELSDYYEYFREQFARVGYSSSFYPRHSQSQSSWSGFYKRDGCGVFFKDTRFELVDQQGVNYADAHDRVAYFVLLRDKLSSKSGGKHKYVMVASTHLYWDSKAVEVQQSQLSQLEERLQEFIIVAIKRLNSNSSKTQVDKNQDSVSALTSVSPNDVAIVLSGDFNSTPASTIYSRIVTSLLQKPTDTAQAAVNKVVEQNGCESIGMSDSDSISTAITCTLQSAYSNYLNVKGNSNGTNGDGSDRVTKFPDREEIITSSDVDSVYYKLSKLRGREDSNIADSLTELRNEVEEKQGQVVVSPGETAPDAIASFGAFEPPATSVTSRRCECIDFIFYSTPTPVPSTSTKPLRLVPISILDVPELEVLKSEGGGIPSSRTGSDHVAIAASFSYAI